VELRIQAPALASGEAQPAAASAPAKPSTGNAPAVVPVSGTAQAASQEKEDAAGGGLGPASYSQLGPPRPGSKEKLISPEGGWASLYEQLKQRRHQLAQNTGVQPAAATPDSLPSHQAAGSRPAGTPQTAPPANMRNGSHSSGIGDGNGRGASLTPGATRPRAGVRRSAMGPMLRMLREADQLS
jgi:hypothetical protein